jgi:hypothetical protein
MPFFLDGNPTQTEISEAINYLLGNSQLTTSTNIVNGQVTDAVGNVVSYLYKYLYVKYADSFDGTVNFSNSPTGRSYYGLRNNDSSTESTNPADYVWYQVTGGFGSTKLLFYSITGGRRIDIVVGLAAPSPLYQADSGAAIDLDIISGSDGASSRICYAKSTSTSLSSTPSTYQTSGPSSFPPTNTWGGAETWQATPPTLAVNEALFQSDGIYNPMTDLTTWNAPYLSNLKVGALSAISANLGNITAGDISVGSSPVISGTTMTGAGSHLYSDGRFITGNSTTNMVFNGTDLYLNGFSSANTSVSSGIPAVPVTPTTILTFTVVKAVPLLFCASGNLTLYVQSPASTPAMGQTNIRLAIYNSSGTIVDTGINSTTNVNPYFITYTGFPQYGVDTIFAGTVILNLAVGTYTVRMSGSGAFITAGGTTIPATTFNSTYRASIYQASI